MAKRVKHLYRDFVPENYQLKLAPDSEKLTFSGSIVIKGKKTGRPSSRFTFHQHGLNVTSAKIIKHDKRGDMTSELARINNQNSFDEVRLHTVEPVYPGNYTITLEFNGTITRNMEGIYPCFFEEDGQTKKLIATQFESHHAREAFPCIDEPEAKATFDLTIISPIGQTVIANTPILSQTTKDNNLVTTFETTPKMSTYLLAFAYGDLKYKEAKTNKGTVIRAYSTPQKINEVDFALDFAVKTLEFYNDYFAIDYPLAKCDLIALPDFASGAMENWGLITFREQCMLVDPKNTSLSNKQYVAMVVAHELAHQWFGNLVTMRWWTDLWLNEGFASWIEYLAVDHIYPEWEMWPQFIGSDKEQGLRLDALEHTHPIEVTINHPDEIRTIFDSISYSKGSSIIHMLQHYLGADTFRDGLRYYLKKHAYGNTDTTDLWSALEHISGQPVGEFMKAWTTQSGYPIVKLTASDESISLEQTRFQLNPKAKKDDSIWPIPLLTDDLPDKYKILDKKAITIAKSSTKNSEITLLNRDGSGFYRTFYDEDYLKKLGDATRQNKLSPVERTILLSDSVESVKAGHLSADTVLELIQSYDNETNSVVWDIIASFIGSTRHVMNDEDLRESLKPYVNKLSSKQLARLGWDKTKNESHLDTLLRPTILGLSASSDNESVLAEIDKRFANLKKSDDIEPDFRNVIYSTVARRGGEQEFNKLLKLHNDSNNSEEQVVLSSALTGFKEPKLIKKALAMITTDKVRLQDASYWIAYSFMNRFARDLTWQWTVDNWQWITDNLGRDLSFYRMPIYVARAYSDINFLKTFEDFFAPIATPALERSINQGIEMIEWQSAWQSRDVKLIKDYLKK